MPQDLVSYASSGISYPAPISSVFGGRPHYHSVGTVGTSCLLSPYIPIPFKFCLVRVSTYIIKMTVGQLKPGME